MEQTKEKVLEVSSLKDLNFDGTGLALNLEEDAWSYAAPPPRGVYDLKCFLAKDWLHARLANEKDNSSMYIMADIEARIMNNEEYEETPCYTTVSTRIFRRRNISTMAGFLVKAGASKYIPNPATPKQLAELLEKVLHKEPVIKAELDWRGAYSYKDAKTGNDVWENSHNHYEEFPVDPENKDKRINVTSVTGKDGLLHEIRAQLRVVRFFGKGDQLPTFNKKSVSVVVPAKAAGSRLRFWYSRRLLIVCLVRFRLVMWW